ncbi:hypothetical protein [Methylobacterium goesingense]|uniref:Uncharacterized protein n=1 Tax=Methylobacterium goesingense TaxID=243690 RepID=A0ABV2L1K2_9HYPH|nr:hypothetical protein [Methylobacterium goesingense]GJD72595.1 hypothetical protein CFIICLFH_0812 [Methylobacterium goesingense]
MSRPVRLLIGVPPFLALRVACLLAYAVEAVLDFLFPRVDRALSRLGAWMEASR